MRSFALSRARAFSFRLRSAVSRDISTSLDIIFEVHFPAERCLTFLLVTKTLPSSVLDPTQGASATMDRRQHDPSQRLFLTLFGLRQVAGVICLYYMHLLKRRSQGREGGRRRAHRQTDDQTSLLASFFSLLRLLTRFCFGTTSLPRTDSLIQPSRRRLFSRSIFICATCNSALPWAPYHFPRRSLGNRTFKAAHLKEAGPTQHSLMGPWEVA